VSDGWGGGGSFLRYVIRSRWTFGRLGGVGRIIFISEEMSGSSTFLISVSRVLRDVPAGHLEVCHLNHYGKMNCDSVHVGDGYKGALTYQRDIY
jgi:hypothetical protein